MSRTLILGVTALIASFAGACVVAANDGSKTTGAGTGGSPNSTTQGLPCDVSDMLGAACTSCHSDPPQNGAPTPLLTYADLTGPSKTNPSISMAEASLARMQATTSPMPPGGATADQIAVLSKWIDAGMPQGSCDTTNPGPDPAFTGALTCTSGKTWPSNQAGKQMYPGNSCNQSQCHGFSIGGTVYPTGHEPNFCYGINGPAMTDVIVRITDKNGKNIDLHPNASGNFYLQTTVARPYTAKVISSKGERPMLTPQNDGNCNLCHTADAGGNKSTAPGRIVVPY